jgi:PAS domain S-box-containing protein
LDWTLSTSQDAANILDAAPESYIRLESEFRYTLVNRAAEQLLGRSRDELLGNVFWDTYPELVGTSFEENLRHTMTGRVPVTFENFFERWQRWDAIIATADSGGGIVVHFADITERKRAEQGLREAEEQFRSLFVSIPLPIFLWDLETLQYLEVNDAAVFHSGYSRNELLRMRVTDLLPPEVAPAVLSQMQVLRTQSQDRGHGRHRLKDGRLVDVEVDAHALPFSGRRAVLGVIQDITERQRAEEALRKSEEWHRTILQSAMDGFWLVDTQGHLLEVNETYCRMSGYRAEELLVMHISDLQVSAAPDDAATRIKRIMAQGESRFESRHRRKDGSIFDVEVSVQYRPIEGGRLVGFLRDITERKRAEGRIARYLQELEAARTTQERNNADLARMVEQLAVEKDRAEAATCAKSEFLSSMSHEIRTPMNGVIGMTGLLLDTPLTPEQAGYAEAVRSSGEALLDIINDILDFSKLEAGKLELEIVPFDLQRALEDVVGLLDVKAHEKKLELLLRYAPDAPREFLGAPGRIRQVVLNLVSNAIKFTDSGHVLVEAESKAISGGVASIRIAVRDTGIGIPAERQGMLFQKFQQLDSSTTRKYGGTGLGLAISKQLVELMGGTLSLTSQVGEGSTFAVEIPLQVNPLLRVEPREGKSQEPSSLPSFAGKRVLLAEDNIVNQKVAAALLGKLGCRVDVAANGLEASDMAAQLPYDLIFMDCQMPEMDGYQATSEIRQREGAARHTPIIALTAGAMTEDRERCLQAGMDDYVSKPFHVAQLSEMLDKHLGLDRPVAVPVD